MITLSGTDLSVTLPDEMEWVEELAWSSKVVREQRAVTGKLIRTVSSRIGGRPVTLQTVAGLRCPLRSVAVTLHSMVELDEVMTLAFSESESLQVTFRHEPTAIEVKPALGFTRRAGNEPVQLKINLSTVATS